MKIFPVTSPPELSSKRGAALYVMARSRDEAVLIVNSWGHK